MGIHRTDSASRHAQWSAGRASSSTFDNNVQKYGVVGAAAVAATDAVAQGVLGLESGIKTVALNTVSLENAAKSVYNAVTQNGLVSAGAIAAYAAGGAALVKSAISKLV
ncbi:MAG: hypothetical protein ABIP34_04665 [Rhodoferax sp.]|uniref:hypothetical protein n=1 Tax=Rhodoferax sp. TaxID=50421 RepID=UPI0032640163